MCKHVVLDIMSDAYISQLTAQELTTMMRHKLNPIVFVLNNKGYTIERYLHGKTRKYNDVVNW